jgi:hypothetical protein
MLTNTDENLQKSFFNEIMSKTSNKFSKALLNKIDELFCEVKLEGSDEKLEFSDAHMKIKRKLESDFRTFREYLESEANKQLSSVFESG